MSVPDLPGSVVTSTGTGDSTSSTDSSASASASVSYGIDDEVSMDIIAVEVYGFMDRVGNFMCNDLSEAAAIADARGLYKQSLLRYWHDAVAGAAAVAAAASGVRSGGASSPSGTQAGADGGGSLVPSFRAIA